MKEITEKTHFGIILQQNDGTDTKVHIEEISGIITEGIIRGYSSGGYEVQGEIVQAAVCIQTEEYLFRIVIDNIQKLMIGSEDEP